MSKVEYRRLTIEEAGRLREIDRSETIDLIYVMQDGVVKEKPVSNECPTWNDAQLLEIQDRFRYELENGGMAIGAFDGDPLVGFGVLAHQFRGEDADRLQVDLMYVSRSHRRQGIGSRIIEQLSEEARRRGASYLYISSTETRSAVSFYRSVGSRLADEVDEELFRKEPLDIHMLKKL
ncbi:GNAT family N-acetyltransferase [Cohnella lubricantis]|uniref:GNAT family N-acetyltransferase n=1 Tax=Cohnella lubricantis TaxID=2163172 RepID=A0A841TB45_9BACL|nr:GNAT family N-acetyltransferase [Cohnella lubricantis]MBB6676608.1 GNAT family N-acetyltransferase [Cohnella lubricantis]MBP2117381.1 GNAT superfamily N-acetyltransferase [Cohnella lubricantis]